MAPMAAARRAHSGGACAINGSPRSSWCLGDLAGRAFRSRKTADREIHSDRCSDQPGTRLVAVKAERPQTRPMGRCAPVPHAVTQVRPALVPMSLLCKALG